MSPPSWVLKLGDKLRSETTALGDKLRTETTAFVELLKTPSPNDTINVPISSSDSGDAQGAAASSSSGSGFMELVAVTTFLALLVGVAALVLMEDNQIQDILDRTLANCRGLVSEVSAYMHGGVATRSSSPAANGASPAQAAEETAKEEKGTKSTMLSKSMAESYVEVEHDAGDFEIIGRAKWHERSFVDGAQ